MGQRQKGCWLVILPRDDVADVYQLVRLEAGSSHLTMYLSLNDYINVKYVSVNETAGHASLRYLSTLAVLQLDAILPNAKLKESKPANPTKKNQKGFSRMLVMEYYCPGIGLVRLTVGQKSSDGAKVQYCITAIAVCS